MLTQDQINQLDPLMDHPRYGNLLKDAVQIWKQENVTPSYAASGLLRKDDCWKLSHRQKCCLIGASLVGKKYFSDDWGMDAEKYFSLNENEIRSLYFSFDGDDFFETSVQEALLFAQEVRKIVNPSYHYTDIL
jgi:hypothetical protein